MTSNHCYWLLFYMHGIAIGFEPTSGAVMKMMLFCGISGPSQFKQER